MRIPSDPVGRYKRYVNVDRNGVVFDEVADPSKRARILY